MTRSGTVKKKKGIIAFGLFYRDRERGSGSGGSVIRFERVRDARAPLPPSAVYEHAIRAYGWRPVAKKIYFRRN